ncbi:unnamed protein product [Brassicogethes aeneus]|uniref:Protein phosphatase 1D n=1 Tax=Brassicogethes aeneus TaxID=1431903 RepID=A0A9P0AVT6_BRAAE|nr:unnamed protein product [Brassicogethes aeneus]
MPASIGVNLRVTGHCRQGGRKYMEDYFTVAYQQTDDEKDLEYAFFGIYDGHGGAEAAIFAKEHLMETIIRNKNFWSDDDEEVLRAIKEGYVTTHYAMWREQEKWPKTASGLPSTAGTTASVAFIRKGKIYIGHVGDSGIILGYQDPDSSDWKARQLTRDHKPENAEEMSRINACGGKVVAKSGVPRVVWNRPRIGHKGPVRRSTPIDEIPFLAVARSLGDLWSYNSALNQFVVSPDPDCSVIKIDPNSHRCLIFGTDGLYNMLSAQMAVHIVQKAEKHNEQAAMSDFNLTWLNPSKLLVEKALQRWHTTKMRADNTSVITLMLDPPGPPRAQVLKDRRQKNAQNLAGPEYPDRGLKIVTRYENETREDCRECLTNSESVEEIGQEATETLPPSTHLLNMNATVEHAAENSPHRNPQKPQGDTDIDAIENSIEAPSCGGSKTSAEPLSDCACLTENVTSSDNAANLPLKERNFTVKPRESTSFDPRVSPDISIDKENQLSNSQNLDNTIQIHEISSSSNDEDPTAGNCAEQFKHNLRSSTKQSLSKEHQLTTQNNKKDNKGSNANVNNNNNFEDATGGHQSQTKRKCPVIEEVISPRKSVRLDTKKEEMGRKSVTLISTNQRRQPFTPPPRLTITQKILKSKKLSLKKKEVIKKKKMTGAKKIKLVLDTVRVKVQKKAAPAPAAAEKVDKKPKEQEFKELQVVIKKHVQEPVKARVVAGKLSQHFQRRSQRNSTVKKKATSQVLGHSDAKCGKPSSSPKKKSAIVTEVDAQKPKESEKPTTTKKKKTLRKRIRQRTVSLRRHVANKKN